MVDFCLWDRVSVLLELVEVFVGYVGRCFFWRERVNVSGFRLVCCFLVVMCCYL